MRSFVQWRNSTTLRCVASHLPSAGDQRAGGWWHRAPILARRQGVHSAMPMAQAIRICPQLLVISANHRQYRAVSRAVMARVRSLTPLVEQISIDEAFLDVSDLPDAPEAVARQLQALVRSELGLPCSLGVATNKLVAKIANNVGKAAAKGDGPPNAIQVVEPGKEAEFLAPLPCDALWGVGPKTAARLAEMGVHTIGDIALQPESELARRFGKHGRDLALRAKGIDTRPVVAEHEAKSISQEVTFARDIVDGAALRRTIRQLAERVGRQLMRKRLTGTTVKLKLRWSDFTTPTRQRTLDQPTYDVERICDVALQLFESVWQPGQAVRLLGVGVSGLGAEPRQMSLWDEPDEKQERLSLTVKDLRNRFGDQAIQMGSELEEEQG